MVAGRPPVPNERKRKLGNPGQRAMPDLADVGSVAPVENRPPMHLEDAGRKLWERVTGGAHWLADSDTPTLILLCEKYDRRAGFLADLSRSEPVLYTDKGYAYPNPLVGMLSTIETEIARLFSALGLTPTDRTRMGVAEVKARNAFEEMLARRSNRE
ncbi:phage terminase small subunit P27 family [Streptomyces sp. SDr-06]|nr:phage terminase small subunit P27 family [Streptomyces sp. SDr-06]